ncbi:MAG: autotransporter domain-containing protein [Planctomycetia bacterium]|nr:autotransporter domain-containing protein [Planctomycetia bacterium]
MIRSIGKSTTAKIAKPRGETLGETALFSPQDKERTLTPSILIWLAIAVLLVVLFLVTAAAQAQSTTLTIDADTTDPANFDTYSAVQWNGAFSLSLTESGELNQALINTDQPGAVLELGDGTGPSVWAITTGNSSKWTGYTHILDGSALTVSSTKTYALGNYSTTGGMTGYAMLGMDDDSLLDIDADVDAGQILIGPESTVASPDEAEIDIAAGKTLTVHNGLTLGNGSTLTKSGAGTLQLRTTTNAAISLENADLVIEEGMFSVVKGNASFKDVIYDTESDIANYVGGDYTVMNNGTLDIQNPGEMVVDSLNVASGGSINFYVNTATGKNTLYNVSDGADTGTVDIDQATFNIVSDLNGKTPNKLSLIYSEGNNGTGDATNIIITDNILGKHYVLQATDDGNFVVVSDNSEKLTPHATTTNTYNEAVYLDNAIDNGQYSSSMYGNLSTLIQNPTGMKQLTGELYASAIGREFMNNIMVEQAVFEHLRAVPLATWTGSSSVAAPGTYPYGDSAAGYSTGGLDTAPYGPGYAPVYENGMPLGEVMRQESVFDDGSIYRGQELGDPGTLIYSAWGTLLSGRGSTKNHGEYYGYDSRMAGGLLGLDLFCSSDCRSGVFYSYMQDKIRDTPSWYGNLKSDEHTLGLYNQFGDEFVYNLIMLRGVYSHWKTDRTIAFNGINDAMHGKVKDYQASASYERGANFGFGSNFILTPFAGAGYTFLYRDTISETSTTNSGFALSAGKKNYHSLHSNLGAKATLKLLQTHTKLDLNVHGLWIHEFLSDYKGKTTMEFSGIYPAAGSFTVYGNSMGRDWCLAGAGAEWIPVPAFLVYVNWDYLKNKYVADHYGSLGCKVRW